MLVAAFQLQHANWTSVFISDLSALAHDQNQNNYGTNDEKYYEVTNNMEIRDLLWCQLENKPVWKHLPDILFRLIIYISLFVVIVVLNAL